MASMLISVRVKNLAGGGEGRSTPLYGAAFES